MKKGTAITLTEKPTQSSNYDARRYQKRLQHCQLLSSL